MRISDWSSDLCCYDRSASAGMALGEVNDVTSILASPVRLKPLIRSIFCSVGTKRDSIWNPSRTETSWMYSRWPLAFCMSCPSNHAIGAQPGKLVSINARSEEHTSELQSLMRISYAVFCLKKKTKQNTHTQHQQIPQN